jgi:hypothetical protein
MLRSILAAVLLAGSAFGADWVEYRTGPFHVFSDAGDRDAREALTRLEQLRYVLAAQLGKTELTTVWPIHLVLFDNQKEYGPHATQKPLVDGGSATLISWTADTPMPHDLLAAITARLIDDNAGRMPEDIETALCDLFSTIDVNATHVKIGAPLGKGELGPERLRAWAKLQMLATQPEYAGKLRVYLNNLQNVGGEEAAARNAFDMTPAQLKARVNAYMSAGKFEAAPANGEALNPNRDFIEKDADRTVVDGLITELAAGGKSFPPESPRGLLAKNTRSALELAIKANPRWAEPHFKLATLEADPAVKIAQLKQAATLAPRNASYWRTLAEMQAAHNLFADAEKSWTAAERAAVNPAERQRIHQAKLDLEDQRAAFEAAEKKRALEEEARDLERVKEAAAAEVRAAEEAANKKLAAESGPLTQAPVPWSEFAEGQKVSGTLTKVECINGAQPGAQRLTIRPDLGTPIRLLLRDPKKMGVTLSCTARGPNRKIEVQHDAKADAKFGTAGDIVAVQFP